MKVTASAIVDGEILGRRVFEIGKKTKVKDLGREISRKIGGDEFRKIALIEDFMRMVFSADITVPVRICDEAYLLPVLNAYEKVDIYFLFERRPVLFKVGLGEEEETGKDEKLKDLLLNSGHYVGTYALPPFLSIQDLTDFINRKRRLVVDTSALPDKIELKAFMRRKKYRETFGKETPFFDVALEIMGGLGLESDVYFRVFKGDREKCLLLLEFPPHQTAAGFSSVTLGEVVALFGREFSIDYQGDKVIALEVIE